MRAALAAILAGSLLLYACSDDDGSKSGAAGGTSSSSSGSPTSSIPDPGTLYETLAPATPDKLRGVWANESTEANGLVEVRLAFSDEYIAVAVRCTPQGKEPFEVPEVAGYVIEDVDTASGQFEYGGISISGTHPDGTVCGTRLPDGTLKYAVTGTALKLTKDGEEGEVAFTKVGDL